VAAYLAREWEIDPKRIKVVGNGSSTPLCNEANPASEGVSLEDCRAMNRTTRLAVLSR
jgi:outer membrane protein OmpA-like peptidoglycan-associated protein